MQKRARTGLPPHIYLPEEWRLVEKAFAPQYVAQMETVFATSNGYLGIRGTFEEKAPVFQPGTFVNRFHETWPIVYGEEAYGFATTGQTMLNLADARLASGRARSARRGRFSPAEIYVLPFLIYTEPRIARNLLRFRHGMLVERPDLEALGPPGGPSPRSGAAECMRPPRASGTPAGSFASARRSPAGTSGCVSA